MADIPDSLELQSSILLDNLRHETKTLNCPYCDEKFLTESNLQKHSELHDGIYFKCFSCGERFPDLKLLKAHDLQHSLIEADEDVESLLDAYNFNEILVCHICNERFESEERFFNHSMVHLSVLWHDSENSEMNLSTESSDNKLDFSRKPVIELERLVINKASEFYNCMYCKKSFKDFNKCLKHQASHLKQKDLMCNVCGKVFAQNTYLKKHLQIHERPIISCLVCGKFLSEDRHAEHMAQFHDMDRKKVCKMCGKRFFLKCDLERHVNAHTGTKNFSCETCNQKFVHKSDLTRHIRNHFGLKPFQCSFCDKSFVRNYHLQRHTGQVHTACENPTINPVIHFMAENLAKKSGDECENYQSLALETLEVCHKCNKSFFTRAQLDNHFAAVHKDSNENQCHLCFRKFEQYSDLQDHMLIHKGKREPFIHKKLEVCHVCNRKFSEKSFLEKHFSVAHKELKVYQCHICFKQMTENSQVLKHVLLHENKKKFKCKVCTKSFSSQFALQQHSLIHVRSKTFNCRICDRNFATKSLLNIHTLNHKKTFKCAYCDQKFASQALLHQHFMLYHNESRKHLCKKCGKRFLSSHKLGRHMTCHSNERPFMCNLCEKTYARKDHLQAHIKNHENRKYSVKSKVGQFKCDVCEKAYARKDGLEQHKKCHETVKYYCNICPKSFTVKWQLENHIAVHEHVKGFKRTYETTSIEKRVHSTNESSKCKILKTKKVKLSSASKTKSSLLPSESRLRLKKKSKHKEDIPLIDLTRRIPKVVKQNNVLKTRVKKEEVEYIDTVKKEEVEYIDSVKKTVRDRSLKQSVKDKVFICNFCKKDFKTELLLKRHMVLHPIEVDDISCDLCGETFHEKFNLEVHLMNHNQTAVSHACKQCNSSFARKSLLMNHIRKTHSP